MAQEDTNISNQNHIKEKYTRTGDIMATDEVKVQSHSDYEYGGDEVCFLGRI